MEKFTLKSFITRLSLMFFILFCSVFTSENAFSLSWSNAYKKVTLDPDTRTITFKIQVFNYNSKVIDVYNFLKRLEVDYSVHTDHYVRLFVSDMDVKRSDFLKLNFQEPTILRAKILFKEPSAKIMFTTASLINNGSGQWLDMHILDREDDDFENDFPIIKDDKSAFIEIKWTYPEFIRSFKSFRVRYT